MKRSKYGPADARRIGSETRAVVLLACGLLLAGCVSPDKASSLADRPFTQSPGEWNQPVKPFRIIGNVYYVGTSGISSYLVATPDGLILLDCGPRETAALVLENIQQLGFAPRQVKILVGLHGHYDHVGGAALVKNATGAKLFVGAAGRALVESGGRNDDQWGDTFAWQPVSVDRGLRDGDKVRLGGVELMVRSTPGHTRGSITCLMKTREADREYGVVFAGSVSCPDYRLVGNPRYPDIAADFERTFETLKALSCDVFLAEHGWDFALPDKIKRLEQEPNANPFIDPTGYRQYLERAEARYHDQLVKQTDSSGKRGPSY